MGFDFVNIGIELTYDNCSKCNHEGWMTKSICCFCLDERIKSD